MVVNYNFCFLCFVAPCLEMPKAATRGVLYEGVFLEICQNLCQGLFFNKVAGQPATLLKTRDSGTSIFLWILQNF